MKTETQFPTIHLNGTGYDALKREVDEAITAVREAMDIVNNMTVHSRDYYIRKDSDSAWYQAVEQSRERNIALNKLYCELIEYRVGIVKQKRG